MQLISVPLLIALNAFFVAAEYAVVSLRSAQIVALRNAGRVRVAAAMSRLKADMPSAIGAIQVCITMTNLLLGWLGEPAMSRILGAVLRPLDIVLPARVSTVISTVISFLTVTLLTVVLSELLPKALTLQHTLHVVRLTAIPMQTVMHLTRPLVWVMNRMASLVTRLLGLGPVRIEGEVHSADEIMVIATEAAQAGVLTQRERSLILNSLSLGKKTAEQIMVPRVRVAYLDIRRTMDENLMVVERNLFSRLPLTNGDMDHVIGMVYTKDFLTAYRSGGESSLLPLIAEPAVFAPTMVRLDQLLQTFHDQRTRMIFLVDEHGGVEGLVTLTDVFDELFALLQTPAGNEQASDFR